MRLELEGRVAIVTGASKGIGKAVATALAREGADVCIVARNQATLDEAADEIRAQVGRAIATKSADVTRPEAAGEIATFAIQHFGHIDILVNNAGGPAFGSVLEVSDSDWDHALQISLRSAIRACRSVIPHMKERRWGRLLNITSTIAKEPSPNMVLSATARAGLMAFAKAIATELAPFGITVNTICPGGVSTERLMSLVSARAKAENASEKQILESSVKSIPIGRFATPSEIADVVTFLASERARYVTGTSLMVDGGLTKGV